MKSMDELLSRFNDIQDLPVSEEMLGAYVEGTLQDVELSAMSKQITSDSNLGELLNDAESGAGDMVGVDYSWDIYEGDYGYWELGIPPVSSLNDESPEDAKEIIEDSSADRDIKLGKAPSFITDNDNLQASMKKHKTFGYEPNKAEKRYDPLIDQGPRPSCAIRSQEIILRDYGIVIPQEDLIAFATQQGWYSDDPLNGGTPRNAVGNLLEACGIPTMRTENATIYDIIAELRAGHRVIVSVDAEELWVKQEPTLYKRLFGEFKNGVQDAVDKLNGVQGANHALIVAGVTVNPKDTSDMRVTLIDSGSGDVCIEYSFKDFQNALEDSNCYMVSTTIPAPYQYNYETHEMEPSSFNTSYYPSMAALPVGLSNEFRLDEVYYEKYADYEPVNDAIAVHNNDAEHDMYSGEDIDALQHDDTIGNDINVAPYTDDDPLGGYDDNTMGVNNDDDDTSDHNTLGADIADNNDDSVGASLDNPSDDGGYDN